MNKNNRKGFTIAELLVVIAIVGVLVAVSIPVFAGQMERARSVTCAANRRSLKALLIAAYLTDFSSDAVEKEYQAHRSEFICPDGGTIGYKLDMDTNVITTSCSYAKHQDEATTSGVYTSMVTNSGLSEILKNNIKTNNFKISSLSLKDTNSSYYTAVTAWYNTLTEPQKSILKQYNWTMQWYTKNGVSSVRVFFGKTDQTGGVYKFDETKQQYQYYYAGSVNVDGSFLGVNQNQWGGYVNGKWVVGGWYDTMEEASTK